MFAFSHLALTIVRLPLSGPNMAVYAGPHTGKDDNADGIRPAKPKNERAKESSNDIARH